ncbi:MAG: zf-HC2 domain-containing protein [Planctomycetaceae bacterium]|nr:zf-HC2 domain-containing protein [Planctomycetaceae bacterium]
MHKSNLSCADARHLIHLAVGDDALPEEESRLSEHLHACSDCRAYHAGMMGAMSVLEEARESVPPEPMSRSLWPAMADQLKVRQAQMRTVPEGRRFNVAVAALCVCSLMLALVTAVQNLPTHDDAQLANDYSVAPAMNVGYSGTEQGQGNYQGRLVQVQLQDGSWVLYDRVTRRLVPTIVNSENDDLNF